MDKLLTIFTPTYNRAYVLPRLYNSLEVQSNKAFDWLIVDDGSTDETAALVAQWQSLSFISIKCLHQNNSGKHVAHNNAVRHCETELFMCVDSDDFLLEDAVDVISKLWEKERTNPAVCGIIGPKSFLKRIGDAPQWPMAEYCSLLNLSAKHCYQGETYIALRTAVFRQFLFPVFAGEKFVTECVVYDQISQQYLMRLLADKLYVCEYLDDGYTSQGMRLFANNPKGYAQYLYQRSYLHPNFFERAKYAGQYVAWCLALEIGREKLGVLSVLGWLLSHRYAPQYQQLFFELEENR